MTQGLGKNIKREKLYLQMETNPDDLPKLDPDKLLLHLSTEKPNATISFHNYSEFLNVFNTLIFYYVR